MEKRRVDDLAACDRAQPIDLDTMYDASAPTLDDADPRATAAADSWRDGTEHRGLSREVVDHRQRDANLGDSDRESCLYVTGDFAHDMESLAEFGERMCHASIECYPGCSGNHAQRPRTHGIVGRKHGGPMEALHDDGVRGREFDQLLEALGDLTELLRCRKTLQRDAAGQDRLAE